MKDIEGIDRVFEVLSPHWKDIEADFNKENDRFKSLFAADASSIGRVLRAHLIIENFMDSYLASYFCIDDYESLRLSFYQKAKLLPMKASSAAFVQPGILQLNALRNKFGHTLGHETERHEIFDIYEVLRVSRPDAFDAAPFDAIEAFIPIACAFISVPPKHLEALFIEALARIVSYAPEQDA
ncbi:MAG: hypothetical protein DI498_09375 [Paracoccus denitrificans]|nr:MAG: hypothetical protein DI498_09375 [Paracoccus denitrificans]PZO84083.1 MAG: hypothetical protein DI633_09375 [Paracoccus denitrificans]